MKIIKNDKVKITTGKDKGKTGKVLQVFQSVSKASIEGLNVAIKHLRGRREGEAGQRIEFPAPIQLSNVMLVCPNCEKTTRVGYKIIENKTEDKISKKKVRFCKKCKQIIN